MYLIILLREWEQARCYSCFVSKLAKVAVF